MKLRHITSFLFACVAMNCLLPASSVAQEVATLADRTLRRLAIERPLPEYPKASIDSKSTGVAVISVRVDVDGRVEYAEVLEAPDEHIRQSVLSAVKRWTFGPVVSAPGATDRKRIHGKLILYFRLKGTTGEVLDADQAAGINTPPPRGGMAATRPNVVAGTEVQQISEDDLRRLPQDSVTVVDVRDRKSFGLASRSGSVNIPIDELPARARSELTSARTIVIDCSENTIGECRMAATIIQVEAKVADVRLLVR